MRQAAEANVAGPPGPDKVAELNLGFTQVRSLVSGIAGQAMLQVGNLTTPRRRPRKSGINTRHYCNCRNRGNSIILSKIFSRNPIDLRYGSKSSVSILTIET